MKWHICIYITVAIQQYILHALIFTDICTYGFWLECGIDFDILDSNIQYTYYIYMLYFAYTFYILQILFTCLISFNVFYSHISKSLISSITDILHDRPTGLSTSPRSYHVPVYVQHPR